MGRKHIISNLSKKAEKELNRLTGRRRISWIWFFIILAVYIMGMVLTMRTSGSDEVIFIHGNAVPLRSFTGAFSGVNNLCIVFLVVFFGKTGFLVSMVTLLLQFPMLLKGLVADHVFTNIAGIVSNALMILMIYLIYHNNCRVEEYQDSLRKQAITDRLTGLPNRFASTEMMDALIGKKEKFALGIFNIRNFKGINNTMGQSVGNEVLQMIASRLGKAADEGASGTLDFVASQGGDEFSVLIRGCSSDGDIAETLEYYKRVIEGKLTVEGCDLFLTSNTGYAEYPSDGDDSDTILACAQTALNTAKRNVGSNQICRYTSERMSAEKDLELEQKIRSAMENDRLFYFLQPQFAIDHKIRGFEVLARMKDENGVMISPADFIPAAERMGMIDKVDYTVFRKSAMFFGELIRRTNADITLSINVSVRHMMKNGFMDEIRSVLSESGLPAGQLEIEITESIMIDSVEKALRCIDEIRRMGVKLAIDDFGTGYSSLSYLNNFPANLLKVDKSFVDQMNTSETMKKYVAAIISMGHVMNFDVIAEGVEETEQLETLRNIGCDYIQGYFWGRPMPPEEAAQLLSKAAA